MSITNDEYYKVLAIIHAYNTGYSQADRELKNPFPVDTQEHLAYDLGKQEGKTSN